MSNTATPSASAVGSASNTPVSAATYRIQSIKWTTKTPTAGDGCTVKDGSGNVIWQDFAPAATAFTARDAWSPPLIVTGYTVTQLDSGMVFVYFDAF